MNISNYLKKLGALTLVLVLSSFVSTTSSHSYKCLIQMANYEGEKAYVAVSLVDDQDAYVRTIYVQGNEEKWFPDLPQWWHFTESKKESLDAITGATISNGHRNIIVVNLDDSELDKGYKLRFETSVENQSYYSSDAEILLNSNSISNKVDGKEYIRYVRMVPN